LLDPSRVTRAAICVIYLRFIIQPINAPAVKPTANVVATVTTKVSLEALCCVIQKFFGCIAALFCAAPHYSYAILYCIGNRSGCTRSLVS